MFLDGFYSDIKHLTSLILIQNPTIWMSFTLVIRYVFSLFKMEYPMDNDIREFKTTSSQWIYLLNPQNKL